MDFINKVFDHKIVKGVLSNSSLYKNIEFKLIDNYYQLTRYNNNLVYHDNLNKNDLINSLKELGVNYKQFNFWDSNNEYIFKISKKGKVLSIVKKHNLNIKIENHNKEKNYLIKEGMHIPALIDMGIFNKDYKIISRMYDKFRQINRFVEIIDDSIKNNKISNLNIIDFGCGKSYLTFVLYYYLVEIKKINVNIIGLDLKSDVIDKCNLLKAKYGYDKLMFIMGDIKDYVSDFKVDMVVSLHACDVATDYALFNAIKWNAKYIFSVPCCQHEINSVIKSDDLDILTKYGIIKERFSSLITDSIRGNLLEYMGYKVDLMEFVDFTHTPKNILIRASLSSISDLKKKKALDEILRLKENFSFNQKLYDLLEVENILNIKKSL